MRVESFSSPHAQQVIDLILGIQQGEFGVDVTLADQPDLLAIPDFYQKNGGFWIALEESDETARLIGTIALIDFGASRVALRKMFVRSDRRGAAFGVSKALLDAALDWCRDRGIREIYLGTVSILHAAHRFYEKNGFVSIAKSDLPADFPLMEVDTDFYRRSL